MKSLLALVLVFPLLSVAELTAEPFDAYCEHQKSKGDRFRSQPFARLLATPESSAFYSFGSSEEANKFEGVEDDLWEALVRAHLESKGKSRTFAVPSLKEAKAHAGSALVYKVKNKVFENPAAYRGTGQTFSLEVEFRDYDDDYSGLFFWTHGYVVKDSGTFTCVVL